MEKKVNDQKKRATVGRKCSVCSHKSVSQINKLIAEGVSFRTISHRFGMAHTSVSNHADKCLKIDFQAVIEQKKQSEVFDFHETLKTLLIKANKMEMALDKWLTDPENENEYDVSPRDDEMMVVYLDWKDTNNNGDPKRKKAALVDLLKRVESTKQFQSVGVASQATDNRKLYLETLKVFAEQLDRYVKYFPPKQEEKQSAEQEVKTLFKISLDKYKLEPGEAIKNLSIMFPNLDVKMLVGGEK